MSKPPLAKDMADYISTLTPAEALGTTECLLANLRQKSPLMPLPVLQIRAGWVAGIVGELVVSRIAGPHEVRADHRGCQEALGFVDAALLRALRGDH